MTRPGLIRWLAAATLLVAAGACSKDSKDSASTSSTTSTTAADVGTTSTTASSSSTAPAPTLGRLSGTYVHGSGFGMVRPVAFSNGGDPTGSVGAITWSSWGDPTASGAGTGTYVGPDQSTAEATQEPADVQAFDLGDCDGQRMYRKVAWWFPGRGQHFDASTAEDICTGS